MSDERIAAYTTALEFAERQVAATIEHHPDYFPIYTKGGKWHHRAEAWTDWTGGFFAGMMWKFFERAGNPLWRERAERYSRMLEHRQFDGETHDLGLIFLNSYLPWHHAAHDDRLKQVVIQAGRTLAERFNPRGRYLASYLGAESLLIDVIMNVPLLFYVARQTGDEKLQRMAVAHCRTTREWLVRSDGSTAHEGIFDPKNGRFIRQSTQQGLRDDSCWSRGLAWSLYGFSRVYDLTGSEEFLEVSERNAEYWLTHLPDDKVPYWDFAADPKQPLPTGPQKDSSAAAIAACGLWDLARQTKSREHSLAYKNAALVILDVLVGPEYLAHQTDGWEGVLKHGAYHVKERLGVDESVTWGDFFLVEALSKVVGRARDVKRASQREGWT